MFPYLAGLFEWTITIQEKFVLILFITKNVGEFQLFSWRTIKLGLNYKSTI
jgi:hypothetical protein